MHRVNDIDFAVDSSGFRVLVWSDTGAQDVLDTEKRYWYLNLDSNMLGYTPYTGPGATQIPQAVKWNMNESSYFITDAETFQNVLAVSYTHLTLPTILLV